jgi:hypothetical protein
MIKEILEINGFQVFAPIHKQEFDFLAVKGNYILAIIYFKDKKLKPEQFIKTYKKEVKKFIDLQLPYNFTKELWVENKERLYSINLVNPTKITNEGYP